MKICPTKEIAADVVASMTNEKALSSIRMTTGDQYFVFQVKTKTSEYVIRMTIDEHKSKFLSAIYWQEKLIPLGVPLAKFIRTDLDGKYSKFPALLMNRLPGNDLCNIYDQLTETDKRNLAKEIVTIQSMTNALPDGYGYGIMGSYEEKPEATSWYGFLESRLSLFMDIIRKNAVFDADEIKIVIAIASDLKEELSTVRPRPFLWDASERNVIVDKGKISGIVDVDDLCFGDPLFVLALTHAALEVEGHDSVYTNYWADFLNLDKKAQLRLSFYQLFYTVVFMRKHSMMSTNQQKINFNVQKLQDMFQKSLERVRMLNL